MTSKHVKVQEIDRSPQALAPKKTVPQIQRVWPPILQVILVSVVTSHYNRASMMNDEGVVVCR